MKNLPGIALLLMTAVATCPLKAADLPTTVTIRALDLQRAKSVAMTYEVVCQGHTYTFASAMSPVDRRSDSLSVKVDRSARSFDLSQSDLGRLMADRGGFGELGFACGDGVYARYEGARAAAPGGSLTPVSRLFKISPEGQISEIDPP
ncbi:hypothetical protein [Roseateles sp. L2-2]|uniref:hypothetical protein n=1 Tax=Roseateles sp. L2-2 TaxID=3422597 RepID=UPI003D364A44